jgi:hypothetical protein
MTLDDITKRGIDPAFLLLPVAMDSPQARVMMLAIGLQESRFVYRFQKVAGNPYIKGPAKSYWQMERGGGVLGVLTHTSSKFHAQNVCKARGVEPTSPAVWNAIEDDDVLAAAFARLLLWTDTLRLPRLGDAAGGWDLYLRTWRPGKPHPETWPAFYAQALKFVMEKEL